MADAARTEPRDLYDLWYQTTEGAVELLLLHDGLRQKLAFRGKSFAGIQAAVAAKEGRLRTLWSTRLAQQMPRLPEFDEVFRLVRRFLRQAEMPQVVVSQRSQGGCIEVHLYRLVGLAGLAAASCGFTGIEADFIAAVGGPDTLSSQTAQTCSTLTSCGSVCAQ